MNSCLTKNTVNIAIKNLKALSTSVLRPVLKPIEIITKELINFEYL